MPDFWSTAKRRSTISVLDNVAVKPVAPFGEVVAWIMPIPDSEKRSKTGFGKITWPMSEQNGLRQTRPRQSYSRWRWHLDEVFVKINGKTHYLWRAVDHEGEVLEVFVTKWRDRKAAYCVL